MMRLNVRTKLIIIGLVLVILPLVVLLISSFYQDQRKLEAAVEESMALAYSDLDHIVEGVYGMVQAQQDLLQQVVNANLNVAGEILEREGGLVTLSIQVPWEARNQFTRETTRVRLDQLMIGSTSLKQNFDPAVTTPVVDEVTRMVGGTVTIFQRMNSKGDMLRVATNVLTNDDKRAIGTYIPAVNPDGQPNKVVDTVLSGRRFVGRAFVVNAWYVTAYEPVYDAAQNIIGMLYFGVREESAASLRQQIMDIQVGETGYVYVLDSKGNYVISQNGKRDGENILQAKDADGRLFIQDIIAKATALDPGEIAEERYPWKNPGDPEPRVKTVRLMYFEPWDWIIGAGSYNEEFIGAANRIESISDQGTRFNIIIAVGSLVVAGLIWLFFAGRFTKPILKTASFASAVAEGRLEGSLDVKRRDELGTLAESMNRVPEILKTLQAQVQDVTAKIRLGRLRDRADNAGLPGAYSELLGNVNGLADVLVGHMDKVPLPIMAIDKEHTILFINKAGADVGDSTSDAIRGSKCYDLFKTSHCRTTDCGCAKAMESLKNVTAETDAHPEGKDLDIQYQAVPITDADGKLVGAFEIVLDQTEVKQAQRKIQGVASRANEISDRLSSAAEELASQVEEASRGSDIQRERAAETATAMEEMNATVLEVARNASHAAENADHTMDKARSGSSVVQEAVKGAGQVQTVIDGLNQNMSRLGSQAEGIGEIMNVISDIADQTNLLALNAAIEAARAGDAGRGFAVVADEVRKLAEKTMTATKEVGEAIAAIQNGTRGSIEESARAAEAVTSMTELTNQSGDSLGEIVDLAERTADQVRAIATAAEEQSATSEEINRSTEQINQISAETADVMTQSAQAITELAELAQQLRSMIQEMQAG